VKRYIEGEDRVIWCRVGTLFKFLDGWGDRVGRKEGERRVTFGVGPLRYPKYTRAKVKAGC
jgi:hypothetical protein